MDTIIYLYQSKENAKFVIEKWQETEYCLIRLGVPALLWQNLRKMDAKQQNAPQKDIQLKNVQPKDAQQKDLQQEKEYNEPNDDVEKAVNCKIQEINIKYGKKRHKKYPSEYEKTIKQKLGYEKQSKPKSEYVEAIKPKSRQEEQKKQKEHSGEEAKTQESVWSKIFYYFAENRIDKRKKKQKLLKRVQDSNSANAGSTQGQERISKEEILAKRLLEKQVQELLEELVEVQTALCLLGDNPYWTYCVYDQTLWEKLDSGLWTQYWMIPEFEEYYELVWVEQLMEEAICDRYVILGFAPCLGKILCQHAKKIRSITWYLQLEQYTQEVENFIEEFFEEYGLAVKVHILEAEEKWIRVRPASQEAVNVLDFSGEEKISACDMAKGSVWLDMDSLDGKWRRIETRNPKITYFSLKKQWKQRQKAPMYLDTTNKNRYNT